MQRTSYWISASQAAEHRWAGAFSAISQAVNEGGSERTVGDMIARASTLLAGVDRAAVAVSDPESGGLRLVGAYGLTADYLEHLNSDRPLHFRVGDAEGSGPSIRGFRSGRSVAIPDIVDDPAFEPWRQLAAAEGFRSVLAVPLIASGAPLGVLTCYTDGPGQIERSQSELIESLATHAGVVLEGFQLRRQQERTIEELSSALNEVRRHRTLHAELMGLALRGAGESEILEVAGKVLDASLTRTSTPTDTDRAHGIEIGSGEVTSWLVPDRELDADERVALESVSLVVALEEQRRIAVFEAEARNKLDLLSDILAVEETGHDELLDRCRRHGFELDRPHQIVVLSADEPVVGSGRRLARLAQHLAPSVRPRCLTSYRQEIAVVLLPQTEDYAAFAKLLHTASQRELGSTSCSMIVGARCEKLGDYAPSFGTAVATLQLRQRSGLSGTLASFENLGTLQFLLRGAPEELIAFSNRLLAPLRETSGRSGDSLLTLKTYLAHRQRAGATAQALHVHPNTITNRLERIGQLTGGSLDDTEHLLNLRLALLVHEVTST